MQTDSEVAMVAREGHLDHMSQEEAAARLVQALFPAPANGIQDLAELVEAPSRSSSRAECDVSPMEGRDVQNERWRWLCHGRKGDRGGHW